jgi:hypothetical protein
VSVAIRSFYVCITGGKGREMAKKAKPSGRTKVAASKVTSEVIITESQFIRQVAEIFETAKWKVTQRVSERSRRFGGDLIADRVDLARERRYDIECLLDIDGRKLHERFSAFQNYVRQAKQPFSDFDEYWLIGYHFDKEAMRRSPGNDRRFRVLNLDQLRELLALPKPPKTKPNKASTRIGQAALANEKEINLAIDGLVLQINAKLEVLTAERPNSDEAKAKVAQEVSDFERMKSELERIRESVAAFKKGKAPEQEVVKATKSFRQGVEQWWDKKSDEIINTTAKGALLVGSIGLLALMKADSVTAIGAVATVINGGAIADKAKKIGRAIKRAAKHALQDDEAVQ